MVLERDYAYLLVGNSQLGRGVVECVRRVYVPALQDFDDLALVFLHAKMCYMFK